MESDSSMSYETQYQQQHKYSSSPPSTFRQPSSRDITDYSTAMSGFNDIEQRRSSYPARQELVHQGHGSVPQAIDSAMDVYGHQRSQSYHRYPSDVRQSTHLSPQSSADPLPVYYSQHQHPNPPSHNHEQVPAPRRSPKEEQQYYEQEGLHSDHPRQRSINGNSGVIPVSHYQELSPGSYRPPSRSSQSSRSPTTPPLDAHSRSPQTPPLTPSPREYPNQRQNRPHHLHHVSRPGPVNATSRILHKSSTREVAAVGPNRRLAHILSEQKRREKINGGFDELKSVVPDCAQNADSKATILRKAVSYILLLEDELRRYTDNQDHPPQPSYNEYEHEQ